MDICPDLDLRALIPIDLFENTTKELEDKFDPITDKL